MPELCRASVTLKRTDGKTLEGISYTLSSSAPFDCDTKPIVVVHPDKAYVNSNVKLEGSSYVGGPPPIPNLYFRIFGVRPTFLSGDCTVEATLLAGPPVDGKLTLRQALTTTIPCSSMIAIEANPELSQLRINQIPTYGNQVALDVALFAILAGQALWKAFRPIG